MTCNIGARTTTGPIAIQRGVFVDNNLGLSTRGGSFLVRGSSFSRTRGAYDVLLHDDALLATDSEQIVHVADLDLGTVRKLGEADPDPAGFVTDQAPAFLAAREVRCACALSA